MQGLIRVSAIPVSNSLDQDQAQSFGPDLGPTGLQRLSADQLKLVDRVKPSTLQPVQTQIRHHGMRV